MGSVDGGRCGDVDLKGCWGWGVVFGVEGEGCGCSDRSFDWAGIIFGVQVDSGGGRGCIWRRWRGGWRMLLEMREHGKEKTGLGGEVVRGKHRVYCMMG